MKKSNLIVGMMLVGVVGATGLASAADSLYVADTGDVGLGTNTPTSSLHVVRADGSAQVKVEDTIGTNAPRTLFQLNNNGSTKFGIANSSTSLEWAFVHGNSGTFKISRQDTTLAEMVVSAGGNMTIQGTLTEGSDVNSKTDINDIDNQQILEKVSALPVSSWSYKVQPGVKHVGPMAQDFYAAFGLGHTEKGISTLDTSGIALAAIKALNENLEAKEARIMELEEKLAEIQLVQQRLQALESVTVKLMQGDRTATVRHASLQR